MSISRCPSGRRRRPTKALVSNSLTGVYAHLDRTPTVQPANRAQHLGSIILLIILHGSISVCTKPKHTTRVLRPLLRGMPSDAREVLGEPRQRERSGGKVDDEQPGAEDVHQVVQAVGVCDAIYSRVKCKSKH